MCHTLRLYLIEGDKMMSNGIDGKGRYTWNIKLAQIQSAQARKCPKCGRKSAIKTEYDNNIIYKSCRWCDYINVRVAGQRI